MKVFLAGGTGKLGRHVWRQALVQRHTVTAFVRDASKLLDDAGGALPAGLEVVTGDAMDADAMAAAAAGHDAVVSTLSQVGDGPDLYQMTRELVTATATAGITRLIVTAGGGALSRRTPDGPLMFEHEIFRSNPPLYATQRQHIANLAMLYTQPPTLEWTMVCAPMMIGTDDEMEPTGNVVTTENIATRWGTSTYADAASVIVGELECRGNIHTRVGVATPPADTPKL